jgi:hypothetical protein
VPYFSVSIHLLYFICLITVLIPRFVTWREVGKILFVVDLFLPYW